MDRDDTRQRPRVRRAPTKGSHRRNPREFPKRKLRTEAFFGFVFVLIIIYVIGYLYNDAQRPEISQMRVEMGALSWPTSFSGIIVRDEAVYYATDAGALLFHVENHERVRSGRVVASIQDASRVEALQADLAAIDQGVVDTQRQRAGLAINEDEIARRNQAIMRYVDNVTFALATGEIGGIFALGGAVRQSMSSRNQLYFSGEAAVGEYADARIRTLAGITEAISEVRAGQSGIFSNVVDGLEGQLTVNNLSSISRELIADSVYPPAFYNPEVDVGDSLFRIVRSNDWYIAAYISHEYTINWMTGSFVTLFVENGEAVIPLDVQVRNMTDVGGEVYVVFQTNNDLMRFIDRRHISFRFARDAREGFKVPQTAIVEASRFPVPSQFVFIEGNVMAVNIMMGDSIVTDSVTGSFSADGVMFNIMSDSSRLRVGDTIVMDDVTFRIETINTATGVFVTNLGATIFREITTEGSFAENAEYIILDPARNPNLRLFDRIVADARAVSDRLLLH